MHHDLKIWPQYFERVRDGSKTFEVRDNDRGYQCCDTVRLQEYEPHRSGGGLYTGRSFDFKIGYVLPLDDKRVVFSLLSLEAN